MSRKQLDTSLEPRKKMEFRVVYGIIILLFIVLAIIAYWALIPVDVIQIKTLPVPAATPENIRAGRLITFDFNYCKFQNVPGIVERQLISDRVVLDLPTYPEATQKGCGRVNVPLILPYTVVPQTFHVHYKITYQVNPIQEDVEEFNTADFTILPIETLPPVEDAIN